MPKPNSEKTIKILELEEEIWYQMHRHQQEPSLRPNLGSTIDPQKTNQGWPHILFSIILFYLMPYSL